MKEGETLVPLVEPLAAVQRILDRFGHRGVVVGGIAASLLGTPRLTADVDALLLLDPDDISLLVSVALEEGMEPRLPDAEEFARKNRVLLLRHRQSGIPVDISLGVLPFEVETVERSSVLHVGPLALRLPTPEDLIIMKAVAHRPKDLLDIAEVVRSHPGLDRARIARWVKEFADALGMPEIWTDVAPLLARERSGGPGRAG